MPRSQPRARHGRLTVRRSRGPASVRRNSPCRRSATASHAVRRELRCCRMSTTNPPKHRRSRTRQRCRRKSISRAVSSTRSDGETRLPFSISIGPLESRSSRLTAGLAGQRRLLMRTALFLLVASLTTPALATLPPAVRGSQGTGSAGQGQVGLVGQGVCVQDVSRRRSRRAAVSRRDETGDAVGGHGAVRRSGSLRGGRQGRRKPLEAAGAHSPPGTAHGPPSSKATDAELSGGVKKALDGRLARDPPMDAVAQSSQGPSRSGADGFADAGSGRSAVHHEFADKHRVFRIRSADTDGHRSSVSMLVDKMYAWRKYDFPSSATQTFARPQSHRAR
jgi:hypothetical protein